MKTAMIYNEQGNVLLFVFEEDLSHLNEVIIGVDKNCPKEDELTEKMGYEPKPTKMPDKHLIEKMSIEERDKMMADRSNVIPRREKMYVCLEDWENCVKSGEYKVIICGINC